ncbi:MAG TPA: cell wall hydrolase [Phycisphaerales bacterium]|nr:cell wall hydrolase [Phycisphaerales bacterium]
MLAGAANGPAPDGPVHAPAYLTQSGDDLIITGSVAHLFRTSMFSGPNRAEKTNRARLTPDGTDVSSGFESMRVQLAALREPASAPPLAIAVASIDPAQINPALGAIDRLSPAPFPAKPSSDLAYARSDIGLESLTPDAVTKDKSGKKVSDKEIWCMATAIYFEARGESYRGQVAVGQVVMNRVAHRLYPNTICGVVFQNQNMRNACQFSFACDGIPERVTDKKAWAQADKIARGVIDGTLYLPEVEAATHYHATYVYPDWAPRLKRVTKIGHHIFYKFKRRA